MSTVPTWSEAETRAAAALIGLALREDLDAAGDITTTALISAADQGAVQVVARQAGVLAGLPAARQVFATLDPQVVFAAKVEDGTPLSAGTIVAELSGPVRSLLAGERTALNFLTHLSGVASLTRRYVEAVEGTRAGIYDTRKTLPGWRVLQKYAVRAGGGRNHRMGLFDMLLIKDNHLAGWMASTADRSIAQALDRARGSAPTGTPLEVEVDSLDQLADALAGRPDLVLLDNMSCDLLREAVALRDRSSPQVELEASGGVSLETVAAIARTGVGRISVGALTHSAAALDLAFDWKCA